MISDAIHGSEETVTLNVRVPESLLVEIDEAVEERGFVSRSEFVRHQLRAGVNPAVRLSDETLEIVRETEGQLERGETTGYEDQKRELGID